MNTMRLLASAGTVSLAFALATAPAAASNGAEAGAENSGSELALEARGTFGGFRFEMPELDIEARQAGFVPDFSVPRTHQAVPVPPTPELIVRDDIGIDGAVDVNNTLPSVVQMFIQNNETGGVFFNCTGTVINPRTILTAAHCLNSRPSEAYGLPGEAPTSVLIASGVDSGDRLFNYLPTGNGYNEGGVATSTDVVIHPSANLENGALPFPWADVALIAVDAPITDVPSLPMLLSPLTELTRVIQVGYGTNGTGLEGAIDTGSPFLRRIGENQLGLSGSLSDFIDAGFPAFTPSAVSLGFESQVFYWTDFDNPDRTPEEVAACDFTGTGINCGADPNVDPLNAILAIDWFDGDALPMEAGTAPGDSGSPLIATDLNGPPVITAVLSGGFDFFGLEPGNRYGDVSFYNPLYPFFEFITQNTAYKYVSAKKGKGNWSDPNHWTQDLDPGFLIDDGNGNLINGIPEGSEPGVYEQGPKFGTVLGQDISEFPEVQTPVLPPQGTTNFGANIPTSSALLGPGSTGFVPNNTDGTPGTAFAAPAQYFDVLLTNIGQTTVDIDVEVDRLTLDNTFAQFVLPEPFQFTSLIGYEQFRGLATIDGTLDAGVVALSGGIFEGSGAVNTDLFANLGAGVAPGGLFDIGTLTVNGDYLQTDSGALLINARFNRRDKLSDLLQINGAAQLAGDLLVTAIGRARFGDEITVLSANAVQGDFDDTIFINRSPLLFGETRIDGGDVIVEVKARSLRDLFSRFSNLESVGGALDTLRFSGRAGQFQGLFDMVDGAGIDTLVPTLSGLTPVGAFAQTGIATNFAQRFTGQISQRTLALRGGDMGAAGFNAGGTTGFAIAGTNPGGAGELGFFSTVSGSYLVSAETRATGINALEEAAFTQAGELTVGADMRVAEGISVGFAMSNIRNSTAHFGGERRPDDTSSSGAAYAAASFGQGFADMYMGFSQQNFGLDQATGAPTNALAYRSFEAAADGRQNFAGMRAGYAFEVVPGLEAGPVASVDYVRSQIGGYEAFGSRAFGLTVHDRTFTSVGSKAGFMANLDTRVGETGRLVAFGSVAYARELADTTDVVRAHFTGASDAAFDIVNALDPNWISVNAGAQLALDNGLGLGLTASSDMGRGVLTNNEVRATLNWRF
ncbi:MAG: autotransporter domain-containing protein [Erythrobacter sp.]|jgi:uncharacterized protein YhjY with autotransporter beta-barrel domain/V8-like Glu-specific endopeptidase|nr:autotransporter domain-containing protein [Erythrobacter sp.]